MSEPTVEPFRLAYVPGVTPAKWVRVWSERMPDVPIELVPVEPTAGADPLREDVADIALLRLPLQRDGLSVIPLYTEVSVVVVPKEHVFAAVDEVSVADLAEETVLHPLDDVLDWAALPGEEAFERPATTEDAISHVASEVGVLVTPQSLARLHHRRDLTYRPVVDAPASQVGLVWITDRTTDLVDEFVGIVRGRTANSSRGRRSDSETESGSGGTSRRGERTGSTPKRRAPEPTTSRRAGASARKRPGKPRRGRR
ncbi:MULTISPECIES: LysR substrate-binding domain-containing protein [Rhodococcus]|uniref:LysR substrate-binding domain-containing protein n=1 Tax=Rhodococcus TaxID=1827 RepID=UPI0007CD748F|nr:MULTISPECIES: LysR substrate-binding domain-containing protein [Rhodococcus]UTT50288.1 LysR substrate-binding domain-containing protein [Rhodococcus gordoniae]